MKFKLLVAMAAAGMLMHSRVLAWGVWGHTHINRGAVFALPKEMGPFFYNHIDYITEESTVPDIRKYTMGDKAEGPRHYIDLEEYGYVSSSTGLPKTMAEAVKKYSKDTLNKRGMLPWYMIEMTEKLTEAFKKKRKAEILLIAADLGHYVGDAHMPLHTTSNHNGQYTDQVGIHAFWESQLPELFGKTYNLYVGEARCIKDVTAAVWTVIDSSHALSYPLLFKEAKMKKDNPEDKQYEMGADGKPRRNKYNQPTHTYEYAHVYHEVLDGMVERQMRAAIMLTADLWYTAWVNAGKPDLTDLDPEFITDRNRSAYKQDMKAWRAGKVKGCGSEKEF